MKLKYFFTFVIILSIFTSCKKDDDDETTEVVDPTPEMQLVQTFENTDHNIEMYTKSGHLYTGYNDISVKIKDVSSNTYIDSYTINWMPIMEMETMNHSCPKSMLDENAGDSKEHNGFTVFQMPGTTWSMKFDYSIAGTDYSVVEPFTVEQSDRKRVATFIGSDDVKYILAYVSPTTPEIAINDLVLALYKMETMMSFPVVEGYSITLEPWMPSMGHGSPNNTDLTYNDADMMYHGDMSLTMSGYWVLNHKLLNAEGEVLKGEDLDTTEDSPQSSLYLELEF